ncbi:COBRA-like protein 7 [Tanacetum coccineum]
MKEEDVTDKIPEAIEVCKGTEVMNVYCTKDPDAVTNVTVAYVFLQRQTDDLTIMYDVLRTYESDYWAGVNIENHNALGQLNNWNSRGSGCETSS